MYMHVCMCTCIYAHMHVHSIYSLSELSLAGSIDFSSAPTFACNSVTLVYKININIGTVLALT